MILDFAGCFAVHQITKALFSNTNPKEIIARGFERREQRRVLQVEEAAKAAALAPKEENEKTLQTSEAIKQNGMMPKDKKKSTTKVPKHMPRA